MQYYFSRLFCIGFKWTGSYSPFENFDSILRRSTKKPKRLTDQGKNLEHNHVFAGFPSKSQVSIFIEN